MKIFGSTQYVKTEGDYNGLFISKADVEPFEPYLQLEVKSQWDWNPNKFFLVFDGGFTYYVVLKSKENNSTYHLHKKLKEEEITEEYRQLISNYLAK